MKTPSKYANLETWKRVVLMIVDVIVLVAAGWLVSMATLDAINNMSFISSDVYRNNQFRICLIFLFGLCVDWAFSPRKTHYLLTHLWAFAICIPYNWVLNLFGVEIHGQLQFILALLPLIRAVVVLADVLRGLRMRRSTSLLSAYIVLLIAIVYFSALMFFIAESGVNSDVHSLRSAIYWSAMCLSTCGSNVPECTTIGKTLSVVLSGVGVAFFPVFTVYITQAMGGTEE